MLLPAAFDICEIDNYDSLQIINENDISQFINVFHSMSKEMSKR